MTPKQAAKIDHYHVRWPDGVIGVQPYRTVAAARANFTIGGNAIEGFRTAKVRAGGRCPCMTPRDSKGGDAGTKKDTPETPGTKGAAHGRAAPEISEQQECAHLNAMSGGGYEG